MLCPAQATRGWWAESGGETRVLALVVTGVSARDAHTVDTGPMY